MCSGILNVEIRFLSAVASTSISYYFKKIYIVQLLCITSRVSVTQLCLNEITAKILEVLDKKMPMMDSQNS